MRRSAAALSVMLSFNRGSGIREIAMTPEQALQWSKDGILTIPGALPPTDVDRLKAGINKKYGQFLSGEISNFSLDHESATYMPELWRKLLTPPRPCQTFKRWNIVADDPDFIGLIDRAPVFDLVREIMGNNIQLSRSQMIVIPSGVAEPAFLHTDSGSLGQCFSAECCAPLMVSVQYFLTDLHGSNQGNFAYVPGSHRTPFPDESGSSSKRHTIQSLEYEGPDEDHPSNTCAILIGC
jgi:hypothetical protein